MGQAEIKEKVIENETVLVKFSLGELGHPATKQ